MKTMKRGFVEILNEDEMDVKLEKQRIKSGMKWKRVEFAYAESKLKVLGLQICSMQLGQSRKYKLFLTWVDKNFDAFIL